MILRLHLQPYLPLKALKLSTRKQKRAELALLQG